MNNKIYSPYWDTLWINATLATMDDSKVPYGLIQHGAIAILNGKIAWVGAMRDLKGPYEALAKTVYDAKNRCITPGLIDCHTHLVYAGDRCQEFEMRLQGVSYAEIARLGGGIRSTVAKTRAASEEELWQQSVRRAKNLLAEGVTTLEIKSGYGLDLETELKLLRVAKRIGDELQVRVVKTFLGAHALPLEFADRPDDYIECVCNEMLPKVADLQLAECVDVFCEKIGFTLAQTEKVFKKAAQYGLKIKCHAEQLSNMGAALLAARYQALSVDHLEFLSPDEVGVLKAAGTTAVLLPGAFYFLRETKLPPIDALRKAGVPMAIATDCNPGTSPVTSLLLMLNMACTLFRLTPEEALAGVTRHAASALGLGDQIGTLTVGKKADLVLWDIEHPAELAYQIGLNSCLQVVRGW